MFAEKSRDKVVTQVLVVKRASSLELDAWMSWMRIVLGLMPMFLLVSMLLGPLTTALITALLLKYSDRITAAVHDRFHVAPKEQIYLFNVVAGLCISVFGLVWLAILFSGVLSLSLTVVLGVGLYMRYEKSPVTFMQLRLHEYPTPKPTYPIEVYYTQDEMPALFEFRNRIFKQHRARVALVSTGSYLVEAFFSMILPSPLYNSPRMRQLLHYFLGYFMPLIFTLKFGLYLYPLIQHSWLSYFWKDSIIEGLGLVVAFLLSILQRVLFFVYTLFGGDQGPLVLFSNLIDSLSHSFVYFSRSIGFALSIDEGLVYFRAKTREFMSLAAPLADLVTRASAAVAVPFRFFVDFVTRTTNANASLARAWNNKRMLEQLISPEPATPAHLDDSALVDTPEALLLEDADATPIQTLRQVSNASPTNLRKRSRLNIVETASLPEAFSDPSFAASS